MAATDRSKRPSDPLPRPVLAFALAQVTLLLVPRVSVTPFGIDTAVPVVALAELLLLCLLGLSLAVDRDLELLGASLVSALALGAVALGGWVAMEALWAVGLALSVAGCLLAYGLHRYERVALGLVGGESA